MIYTRSTWQRFNVEILNLLLNLMLVLQQIADPLPAPHPFDCWLFERCIKRADQQDCAPHAVAWQTHQCVAFILQYTGEFDVST